MHKAMVLLLCLGLCGCATARMPTKIYDSDYEHFFNKAVGAATLQNWEIISADTNTGVITARTPVSLKTFGDTVSIQITKIKDNKVSMAMSSGSNQIIDWGSNSKNISSYLKTLDSLILDKKDGVSQ